MNLQKIYTRNNVTKILIKGIDTAVISAIRRSAMLNVPVLAIETIHIYKNSSVLFDEFLGSRLGMIPLKTDMKDYKKGDVVKLTLNEAGPKIVYSKDIQSTDPNVEIAYKNIPIVKLAEGQEVKMDMDAEIGTGRDHAKFQPGLVAFNQVPELTTNKKPKDIEALVNAAPKGTLEAKGGKLVMADPIDRPLVEAAYDADKEGALSLEY